MHNNLLSKTFIETKILFIKSFFYDYKKIRRIFKLKTYNMTDLKLILDEQKLHWKVNRVISNIQNRVNTLIKF